MFSPCLSVNEQGHLSISGCDTLELAHTYGTPLYVMSEDEIRRVCRCYVQSFQTYYHGNGRPIYASKAFDCMEIVRIVLSEGLDIEVVSGGELYTALKAGAPGCRIHFQGNNKTLSELELALTHEVGDIVVDNPGELDQLQTLARAMGKTAHISLRITPGIEAHTHDFIRTGQIDSKFGTDLQSGAALALVERALEMDHVVLQGLHCHIGSQILETEPFVHAAQVMLDFYGEIVQKHSDFTLSWLNLGGGFGIHYTKKDRVLPYETYMEAVSAAISEKCTALGLPIPRVFLEPGRSVVGEAGITLYTVGNIKEIPGVRNYVAIDGGMFENPRYALYRSDYTCLIADRAGEAADYIATVAGKCCESGDLIQEHTRIQTPHRGDVLAVLSTGAYNYSMASNYNRNPRPAVVLVSHGEHRLAVRRETYDDLIRCDL